VVAIVAPVVAHGQGGAAFAGCRSVPSVLGPDGRWDVVPLPSAVATGSADGYSHAVDPFEPNRIFVSDGSTVVRSLDAGCSWKTVFSLSADAGPLIDPVTNAIVQVVVPDSAAAHDRVYVLIRSTGGSLVGADPRGHVFRSDDVGMHWRALDGAGLVGWPLQLSIAPSNPDTIYLPTYIDDAGDPRSGVLYVSHDAGITWRVRSEYLGDPTGVADSGVGGVAPPYRQAWCPVPKGCLGVFLAAMATDPLDASSLWGGTATIQTRPGIFRSSDGAGSWSPVFAFDGSSGASAVDVIHDAGSPARIALFASLTYGPTGGGMFWSTDAGSSWTLRWVPWDGFQQPTSVAHGKTAEDLVVTVPDPLAGPGAFGVAGGAYRNLGSTWKRLVPPRVDGQPPSLSGAVSSRSTALLFEFLATYPKGDAEHHALLRLHPDRVGASSVPPCANLTSLGGGWGRIPTPITPGVGSLGGYAVDPFSPRRIYVSDGESIVRTTDGGCTWTQVVALKLTPPGRYPFLAGSSNVTSLVVPGVEGGSRRAYALVSEQLDSTAPRPHVIVTNDGGTSWHASDAGLPAFGDPRLLVASQSDPKTLYLVLAVGDPLVTNLQGADLAASATGSLLYASTDGGTTWSRRHFSGSYSGRLPAQLERAPGRIRALAVDPGQRGRLWVVSEGGELWRSDDAGSSWVLDPSLNRTAIAGLDLRVIAVSRPNGGAVSMLALDSTAGVVYASPDALRGRWVPWPDLSLRTGWLWSPSIAMGGDADTALLGTFKGVFRKIPHDFFMQDVCSRLGSDRSVQPIRSFCAVAASSRSLSGWADISPGAVAIDLTADRTAKPSFYGREFSVPALLRYVPAEDFAGRFVLRGNAICPGCSVWALDSLKNVPTRLRPGVQDVYLPQGGSRRVPYSLTVSSAPVDVYFLVDSTLSMAYPILALQRSMADMITSMRAAGVDAWFGVGEYRTYGCPADIDHENYAYRRDRDIGPPDRSLEQAIQGLEGSGQSGAALTALYQTATGAGQDLAPPGSSWGDVARGMQAHFRPGSLRVVINMTDRYFNAAGRSTESTNNSPDSACTYATWPGPSFTQTIAALNAKGIHQIGLMPSSESEIRAFGLQAGADGLADMRRVASGTHTFAPAAGVDCDGDGTPDLAAGKPLVCTMPSDVSGDVGPRLAASMVDAIAALPLTRGVRFSETSASGVVAGITPAAATVDLNGPGHAAMTVTYRCGLAPGAFPVRLLARVANGAEATASATIHCLPPPIPPILARPVPGVVTVPVPPAPIEVPGPQPGNQPNPQGQPEAHAAVAPETQDQPQPAVVLIQQAIREQETEYAFSARSRRGPLEGARLPMGAAAASMGLAFGWLSVVRARVRTRRARR
jgi:photosystem II stability/assembly factor-like uncharacterized protein